MSRRRCALCGKGPQLGHAVNDARVTLSRLGYSGIGRETHAHAVCLEQAVRSDGIKKRLLGFWEEEQESALRAQRKGRT